MPGQALPQRVRSRPTAGNRSGTITLWTILFLPVLVVLLLVVVEGIHFWLARVELENALEATALAAVKEWAESGNSPGQNWTENSRLLGLQYANANTIRGVDFNPANFAIEDNLGIYSAGNPNENATCVADGVYSPPGNREGTMIFGAVTAEQPYIFTTEEIPSCGGEGTVLIDATGEGNLDTGNDNNWGVAFINEEDTPLNLRICTIAIRLPPAIGNRNWYFDPLTFAFADNSNNIFANEPPACDQNDLVGLNTGLIGVSWAGDAPCNGQPGDDFYKEIRFSFPLDGSVNEFAPCDRFRFSVAVRDVNLNNCHATAQGDGDLMGQIGTTATIVFADSGAGSCDPPDPARTDTATFQDFTYRNRQCTGEYEFCNGFVNPLDRSHILTPPGIPNLPNGAIQNNQNKDGQSFAISSGPGGEYQYAVRAQARIEVPLLCGSFCGIHLGPYYVSACTTAMYDCELQRPRLIRVEAENYTCVVPP